MAQAVAAVNLVLDTAPGAPPLSTRLARVQDGRAVASAVGSQLDRLAGAGVVGVSVSGATVGSEAICRSAKVGDRCVIVHYTLVTKGSGGTQNRVFTAYAVPAAGTWVLARSSACRLPQPVTVGSGFAILPGAAC